MAIEGKGLERLCRESPFTAFPSEATFAVTDDILSQVNVVRQPGRAEEKSPPRVDRPSGGILNIMEL